MVATADNAILHGYLAALDHVVGNPGDPDWGRSLAIRLTDPESRFCIGGLHGVPAADIAATIEAAIEDYVETSPVGQGRRIFNGFLRKGIGRRMGAVLDAVGATPADAAALAQLWSPRDPQLALPAPQTRSSIGI